jgi:hypothetical protein
MQYRAAMSILAAAAVFSAGMGGAPAQDKPPDSTPRPAPAPSPPGYKLPLQWKLCSWGGGTCNVRSLQARIGEYCFCVVENPPSGIHEGKVIWFRVGR